MKHHKIQTEVNFFWGYDCMMASWQSPAQQGLSCLLRAQTVGVWKMGCQLFWTFFGLLDFWISFFFV
jgi:hypothetical protein